MPHPALQAQRAGAGVDEQRRAGVAQRVKARPRHARALGGGDHPRGSAGCPGRSIGALGSDEQQVGLVAVGGERREPVGELVADRDRASAVAGLRAGELTVDDRAAHMDPRVLRVQVDVHHTQRDRLGDPQTGRRQQLEERAPAVGDLGQQPRELLARQKASLVELVGAAASPPRQQDHRLRAIAEQPGPGGVREGRTAAAARRCTPSGRRGGDRRRRSAGTASRRTPRARARRCRAAARRAEVRQRVGDQQPPVLAARAVLITSLAPRPA